ncbi:MAG TPA: uroporphyrinogen-III synthase [Candidatus Acidoferrales bacterium]|nr:uroporphyrinogen-III synthase [Candidatus Acidoferrales bacterium]
MPPNHFAGLRVLSFESRRAAELTRLIKSYGGEPVSAPAMREVPLSSNTAVFAFGAALIAGKFQVVIFLTGVGARAIVSTYGSVHPIEPLLDALRRVSVVVRGPKPAAVLREWNIPMAAMAPEPNTWREVLHAIDAAGIPLGGANVAVQEYGVSNSELLAALRDRGTEVTAVPAYQWALPEDTAPLREAVRLLLKGEIDVVLFTTGVQVTHLFQFAVQLHAEGSAEYSAEALRRALKSLVIASVGPSTTETLEHFGLRADLEPTHSKMGFLVKEAAELSPRLLAQKQQP